MDKAKQFVSIKNMQGDILKSPKDIHPTNKDGRSLSATIDLLVVEDDKTKPELARGLSIRLSRPPEDTDSLSSSKDDHSGPKYYYSLSQMSLTSSGSFGGGDMDLKVPSDKVNTTMQQGIPIHRTESRLPSLETLLADDELRKEIFNVDDQPLTRDLLLSLKLRSSHEKFRALTELIKKSMRDEKYSISQIASSKDKERIIDALVLFVKQELAKHVDHLRFLVDQKAEGQFDDEQFATLLSSPELEIAIHPWALISAALRMLRNFSVTEEVQNKIHAHRIADLILDKKKLMFVAIGQAHAVSMTADMDMLDKPLVEEVQVALPRILMTFLANLLTHNMPIQKHLWNILWPSGYWFLLLIAGQSHFDHFCLLLHNHLSLLTEKGVDEGSLSSSFEDDFRGSKISGYNLILSTIKYLKMKSEIDSENEKSIFEFSKFFSVILAVQILIGKESNHPKISTDHSLTEWLPLTIMKLIGLNRGKGFRRLIDLLLQLENKTILNSSPNKDWFHGVLSPPDEVLSILESSPYKSNIFAFSFSNIIFPSPIMSLNFLLIETNYLLDPNSDWPFGSQIQIITQPNICCIAELFKLSVKVFSSQYPNIMKETNKYFEKEENKMNLKFNLQRRDTEEFVNYKNEINISENQLDNYSEILINPICVSSSSKLLTSFSSQSQILKLFPEDISFNLSHLIISMLFDLAPLMMDEPKDAQKDDMKKNTDVIKSPYQIFLSVISGKDLFLLLTNLAQKQSVAIELQTLDVSGLSEKFSRLQPMDPGCQEAVVLLTKVLSSSK